MDYQSISMKYIQQLLPQRNPDTHKGDYGKILLLCGSKGFTGAPAMAAMAALRTGAGLVYLGVPESIYAIEAAKLNEPVIFSLQDRDGKLSSSAVKDVLRYLPNMDAVLLGPGLGQSEGTLSVVISVLENFNGPVVLDADGINVLKTHKDILRGRTSPTILTPHTGEFYRIGGRADVNRAEAAALLAKDLGVIVVLKGHATVITDGATCYINATGNPGMAVGGSGDALAGIIVSLLGQGISPIEAAAAGAWIHGAAGDICAQEIGQYGMLPSDIINVLPRLLK